MLGEVIDPDDHGNFDFFFTMTQSAKCLPARHEFNPQKKSGVAVSAYNPSVWEAGMGAPSVQETWPQQKR